MTLVPAMAKTAAHVTMLQRSPTYVVSRPARGRHGQRLRARLPAKLAYHLIRWRNVLWRHVFLPARRGSKPEQVKKRILGMVREAARPRLRRRHPFHAALQSLGPAAVPGAGRRPVRGASSSGKAAVVTDQIDSFTETGIRLKSGSELDADIIVTATGLEAAAARRHRGHASTARAVDFAKTLNYKGMMYSGRAEPRLGLRLHQRVLDAEMRPDLRICLPAAQLHGPARLQAVHAAQ